MTPSDDTTMMGTGEPDDYVRLSAHPRARRQIARAKSLGGLIGFVLGFWLGSKAGLPAWDTGVRALAGGIAGYVLVWLAAVQIWRQIAVAEYRAQEKEREMYRAEIRKQRAEMARERREAAAASAASRQRR